MKARRIDDYQGRPVYKVPVLIKYNDSQACGTIAEQVAGRHVRIASAGAEFHAPRYTDISPDTLVYEKSPEARK